MEAVAWSLFGLFGAALGILVTAYWRLAARMDELRRDLTGEVHAVRADLGGRIDAQTFRIDALNSRMDSHIHPHAG
jgi:hypothetical protein